MLGQGSEWDDDIASGSTPHSRPLDVRKKRERDGEWESAGQERERVSQLSALSLGWRSNSNLAMENLNERNWTERTLKLASGWRFGIVIRLSAAF